jgi:hypothetical protein
MKIKKERLAELFGLLPHEVPENGDIAVCNMLGRKRPAVLAWDLDELERLPEPEWILPGWVPQGLTVVYAMPKHGKSYWTISLSVCYAMGVEFFGKKLGGSGRVLYIAAEGGGKAVRNRIGRFAEKLGIDMVELCNRLKVVTWGIGLDNAETVKEFLALNPGPWDLIVADTLARNMTGDENLTADMNLVIKGVDLIRQETGGSVIVVHHQGWSKVRTRGSSALLGALDAQIHVVRKDGFNYVQIEELREAAIPDDNVMTFKLNKGGGVLELVANKPKGLEKLHDRERRMLDVLDSLCADGNETISVQQWRSAVESSCPPILDGTKRGQNQQWRRALAHLKEVESVKVHGSQIIPWRPSDDFREEEVEDE